MLFARHQAYPCSGSTKTEPHRFLEGVGAPALPRASENHRRGPGRGGEGSPGGGAPLPPGLTQTRPVPQVRARVPLLTLLTTRVPVGGQQLLEPGHST